MLNKYQLAQYKDNGREFPFFDCWGVVRFRGHEAGYFPLLESYGSIAPSDKAKMTKASQEVESAFIDSDIGQGVIAAGYIGKRIFHVGLVELVDGELMVLHASQKTGVTIQSLEKFKQVAGQTIRFYKYVG